MTQTPLIGRRLLLGSGAALIMPGSALLRPSAALAAGIETRTRLTQVIDSYMSSRGGRLGLMLHDRRDGSYFTYRPFTNQSLSTIKVLVLVTLLRRSQETGVAVTDNQRSLAQKMITTSDNGATDNLFSQLGLSLVRRVATDIAMTETVVQGGGYGPSWWGYSTTTPRDLLRLEMKILYTTYLNTANRSYARKLMGSVIASQRWGVCDPPLPTSIITEVKNGWGPMSDGYRLNSVGYVYGAGRQYSMAMVSRDPAGFTHGRDTINHVSRLIYDTLDKPLI